MTPVALEVRNYLRDKPYMLEALEKGIVNLSELSRQIQKDLKTNSTIAIKAALRRFSNDLQKHKHNREQKVLQLLKKSTITIYDGKSVAITEKPVEMREKIRVNLEGKFVYLSEKIDLPEMANTLKTHENCAMIVIHSPEELEATPGVVAFLTSLLAENNVNIIEFISCWTDTIIVVERNDSLKTYGALSTVVG